MHDLQTRIDVVVTLSAEVGDGSRVEGRGSFSFGYWPQGQHTIDDMINIGLGRDPELHRPPRLSWDGLIFALAEVGIDVTEDELITTPLIVEIDEALKLVI